MMKTLKALTVSVASLLSALSLAGGMEGGGGVGVRCGSKLELLEVHEAKLRGIDLKKSPKDEEEAIRLVTKLSADSTWYPVFDSKEEYQDVIRHLIIEPMFKGDDFVMGTDDNGDVLFGKVTYVPSLSLSNDYGNYQIGKDCHLEQIAYMEDTDKKPMLKIAKKAWDELDWLSKSVLIVHETLYAVDRNYGTIRDLVQISLGKNSEWTRKYLIKLFSVTGVTGSMEGLPSEGKYISCYDYVSGDSDLKTTEFYAYESSSGLTLLFNFLLDKSEFYQVRSNIKGFTIDDLKDFTSVQNKTSSELTYVDAGVASGLEIEIERTAEMKTILTVFDVSKGKRIAVGKPQNISCN